MNKHLLCLVLCLITCETYAKPRVTITKFTDQAEASKCKAKETWKTDLGEDFQKHFANVIANYGELRVIDSKETLKKGDLPPQYMVTGVVHAFEQCRTTGRAVSALVAVEVRVIDSHSGALAFKYSSRVNVSGSLPEVIFHGGSLNAEQFRESPLGQATHALVNDLAYRVDRALISRKAGFRLVSKNRKTASPVVVELVHKDAISR